MKHIYLITILTLISLTSFSQYYIQTAIKSGNWSAKGSWTTINRTDGKKINSIIIPKDITIEVAKTEDLSGDGDFEVEISGKLEFKNDKTLTFSENSSIVLKDGEIDIDETVKKKKENKKSEFIIIGGVIKYNSNLEEEIKGSLYANKSTGAAPMGFSINAILPVNFVSFNASKVNDDLVSITWTTSDEVNNNHFEIQKSLDGINWKSIAIMFPDTDGGNVHLYKYNENYSVKNSVYYRIRQVDIDGREKYSNVKMIGGAKSNVETLIYVSGRKTITIDLKNSTNNNVMVRLVSMNGVVVNQKSNNPAGEKISLSSPNAAPGIYVVQITDMKGMFASKKVLL